MCFLFKVRQSRKSLGKSNNICFSPADSDVIFLRSFLSIIIKKQPIFFSIIHRFLCKVLLSFAWTKNGYRDLSANIASFPSSHNYSLLQLNFLAKSGIPFHFMKGDATLYCLFDFQNCSKNFLNASKPLAFPMPCALM